MAGTVPGFLPKASLVTGKLINYPFQIPLRINNEMTLTGQALNGAAAGVNGAVGNALGQLGAPKWMMNVFGKIDEATKRSDAIAARNKAAFYDPLTQGISKVGNALGGPFAHYYLTKAGVEKPTSDAIAAVLNGPLREFPPGEAVAAFMQEQAAAQQGATQQGAAPPQEGGGEQGPPPQGASDAAAGAGEAQPPAQQQAA